MAGLALLLGIDRFMSEARAITNLIGNGVASVAVSAWEGELDRARARSVLDGAEPVEAANEALAAEPVQAPEAVPAGVPAAPATES